MGNQTNSAANTAGNSATNSATNYGSNTASGTANTNASTQNTVSASGPSAAGQALIDTATNPSNTIGNIAAFQSPYTQQVLDSQVALQNQQNAIQQQQLSGQAAAQGALGGDRLGIAQGVLGGQQALADTNANANTLQQGFNTAAGLATTTAGQQLQGAGLAGTQGSSGTTQQGQTLGQQLSSTLGGTNTASATANTGAQSGQQVTNLGPLGYVGLAAGLAKGLAAKDGGRIGFADGGSPKSFGSFSSMPAYGEGGAVAGHFAQVNGEWVWVPASSSSDSMSPDSMYKLGSSIGQLGQKGSDYLNKNLFGSSPTTSDGGWSTSTQPTSGLGSNFVSSAGSGLSSLGSSLGFAKGGAAVGPAPSAPSIGNLFGSPSPNSGGGNAFYTPVSAAAPQISAPSLASPMIAAPMVGAPSVDMPVVPQAWTPQASTGKGSGGAVRGFGDGGAPDINNILAAANAAGDAAGAGAEQSAPPSLAGIPAPFLAIPSQGQADARGAAPDAGNASQAPQVASLADGIPGAAPQAQSAPPSASIASTPMGAMVNAPIIPSQSPTDTMMSMASPPPATADTPKPKGNPLTERLESNSNPAAVGSDTGGTQSLGLYQANTGPKGGAWAFQKEFGDKFNLTATPGTPEFAAQWQAAAKRDPEAFAAAQRQSYDNNIGSKVVPALKGVGVPDAVANDPRVQTYFGDRMNQQGPAFTQDAKMRVMWANQQSGGDPVKFIKNMTELDKAGLGKDFPTHLAEHPGSESTLAKRLDARLQGALGNQAATAPDNSTLGQIRSAIFGNSVSGAPAATKGQQGGLLSALSPEAANNPIVKGLMHSLGDIGPLLMAAGDSGHTLEGAKLNNLRQQEAEAQARQARLDAVALEKHAREMAMPFQAGNVQHYDPSTGLLTTEHPYATYNAKTGGLTPVQLPATAASSSAASTTTDQPLEPNHPSLKGVKGEEYLSRIDPYIAQQARGVHDGTVPMPNPSKFNPQATVIRHAAEHAYGNDLDASRYAYRTKFSDPASQFTKSRVAFNTATDHAATLYNMNHGAEISDTGARGTNWLYHGLQRQYSTPLESYEGHANGWGKEFEKTLVTSGPGAASEREEAVGKLSSNKTLPQRQAGLADATELLVGKLAEQYKEWQQKMPTVAPPPLLDEHKKDVIRKIFADEPSAARKEARYKLLSKDPVTADLVSPPEGYQVGTQAQGQQSGAQETRVIDGRIFHKINGNWMEEH